MNNNFSIAKDFLVKLKDYALGISLIGYTAGFIVTNIYLGKYGIANFDIVSARYVLSGIVFLLFSFTCLYPAYISWQVYTGTKKNSISIIKNIIFDAFLGNLLSVIFISAPLYLVAVQVYHEQLPIAFPLVSFCISLLNSVFLVLAFFGISIFVKLPNEIQNEFSVEVGSIEETYSNAFSFTIVPTFLVSLVLIIVFGYSLLVYPAMPQQLGGGGKIMVEVTYKSSTIKKTLYILDRTSNTIIFLEVDCITDEEKAVEVASGEILTLSPVKSNQPVCSQTILSPVVITPVATPVMTTQP